MAVAKPLLIPWLREQINSGRYPGVHWTNEERTEFSVPWKHALRQDRNRDDVLIFRAWAETGLGRQPDGSVTGDPSVWKRNFRSALRARKFTMLDDNKNDSANPHKLFRFPDPKDESQSGASCEPSPVTDSPIDPIEMAPLSVLENIYLDEDIYHNEISHDILPQCMDGLNLHQTAAECIVPGAEMGGVVFVEAFPIQETMGVLHQPLGFAEEVVQSAASVEQVQAAGVQSGGQTAEGQATKTFFNVVVHYGGRKVWEQLVTNENGFRLAYSQPDCDAALDTVLLPPPDNILDHRRREKTAEILDSVGGGLEIITLDHIVYGSRHGDTKVFWSADKHERSGVPRELSKQQLEPIFSFKSYIEALISFMNKEEGSKCPHTSLFFCLGEKWPDPKHKPWDNKLVFVEVNFVAMEKLKTMALDGGATSMQSSVELQISLEQMMMDMS